MDSSESAVVISVENISKRYFLSQATTVLPSGIRPDNSFLALDDISLKLNEGDTLGIIGSNGSGKTTLLKILSSVTAPTKGRITIRGKLIPIIDIGSGFHPDLSGRENIYLYGTVMLGMQKAEIQENIEEIIEFSELGKFIDEPIKNYSNGMYLRLALSVALFCKLDVLLLDEIFSVGDSSFMMKSYDKILKIIKQAATVILASHNMSDIMRICNKCLWLEKGHIKMLGNTSEVVSAYLQANENASQSTGLIESLILKGHSEWALEDAPKTAYFNLRSISIKGQDGTLEKPEFGYSNSLSVDIIYEKLIADCGVGFAVKLTDYFGSALLVTTHLLDTEIENPTKGKTGLIKCSCKIPARMLNEGIYKINLHVFLNTSDSILDLNDALTFKIKSTSNLEKEILKKIPNRIATPFVWEINSLPN